MGALVNVLALVLLGAVFYLLGICLLLCVGILLHVLGVAQPEGLVMWLMFAWSIACIGGALRLLRRIFAGG
jgi:hypothetical protein